MKKIYTNKLILTAFSMLLLIGLMSNSSGRGNVFGQAVTGAPGDSNLTCGSSGCHGSGAFSPSLNLRVLDSEGNEVTSFFPGDVYDITLAVESTGSPAAYGFQMVALNSDNEAATTWSNIGNNTQVVSIAGKDYIEHNSPSSSNEFNMSWTAPEAGSGDVTFYFAANAVNGNGSPSGDGGTNSNFVLSEIITSTNNLDAKSISVYPSPASDFVTISGENVDYNYIIFNINGQKIEASNFTEELVLNISHLEQGLYFISLQSDNKLITKKLYKD